jgi:hypothetical protein
VSAMPLARTIPASSRCVGHTTGEIWMMRERPRRCTLIAAEMDSVIVKAGVGISVSQRSTNDPITGTIREIPDEILAAALVHIRSPKPR